MRTDLAIVALTATPALALTLPNQHATTTMVNAQGLGTSRRGWLSSASALVVGTFTASAPAHALGFGEEAPVPMDLGVFGLKVGSGKLGTCPSSGGGRACISTSAKESDGIYVPPWTYQPQGGYGMAPAAKGDPKPMAEAIADLRSAVESAGGTIAETKLDGRYVRCEFRTKGSFPGAAASVDDVEFLFEVDSDPPALVNYRSATRPDSSGDTKRHRQRIKDLRVALTEKGWASIGRFIT